MLGCVPPMFKNFENPVTNTSFPILLVKNTNFLLWYTYCHDLGKILDTGDTEMHKTQRFCFQGGSASSVLPFQLSAVTMRFFIVHSTIHNSLFLSLLLVPLPPLHLSLTGLMLTLNSVSAVQLA